MRLSSLALSVVLALPLGLAAQTPATTTPQAGTVPVTSETPIVPNGTTSTTTTTSTSSAGASTTPMTRDELKAQRKQQKREEKSAKDNARAAKANSKAVKAQDKATDAAEQTQPH